MRKRIIIFVCIVSIFFTFDIAENPILFKNVNSFSEMNLLLDSIQPIEIKYIDELIRSIPYKAQNDLNVYDVRPKDKYDLTVKNGYGNCSNYVFGASYKLLKDVKEFYILNFYPKQRWAKGGGHTVMLLKIGKELVIVDLLEGGLVFNLNQEDLFSKKQSVTFKSYNSLKDGINPYFPNVFDYDIGIIRSNSVKEYFQFLEMIYIPLGSKKIEKYFFDGLAVFFGKSPSIMVNDRNKLLTKFENFRFQFYLWWFRVIMLSVLALFLRRFLIILNKKVNVWSIR